MPDKSRSKRAEPPRQRGALSLASIPGWQSAVRTAHRADLNAVPAWESTVRKPKAKAPERPNPKKRPPRGVLNTIGDAAGTILDNVLPNAADEVAGFGSGVGYLLTGRDYMDGFEAGQRRFEQQQEDFAEDSPLLHGAATVTGFAGGMLLPAGRVMQGASRVDKARQAAAWGAGYAGLGGIAEGDGLQERATNAAMAIPIGAGVGYVAPGLVDDAIQAAPAVAKTFRELMQDTSGELRGPGMLRVTHSSRNPDLTEVDPSFIGGNVRENGVRFTNRDEVNKARTATGGRSYFGVRTGQDGGYREEQPDLNQYEAYVDPDRYLFTDGDSPDAPVEYDRFLERADALRGDYERLRALGLPMAAPRSVITENLIKKAGYDGIRYGPNWNAKYGSQMGEVLHHWGAPVPVQRPTEGLAADAFAADDLSPVMSSDNWAILTAENPMGNAISAEENLARNEQLLKAARDLGIEPVPVRGQYGGNPENSFMLSPITQEQAIELGKRFEQDSILTNRGLLYGDGTITPATGARRFDEAPEDFFSTIETSQGPVPFAVDLQWDDAGNMVRIPDETLQAAAEAPAAPAILRGRRKPDFGYPVRPSNLRNQPSYEELGVDFEPTVPLAERRVVNPEQLVGGQLIAGMSDLTRAGGILRGIEGRAFDQPVQMQGGQDFMREQAAAGTGSLWASDKGPMTAALRAAREADVPSYYAPFTMNAGASDYSHHMSQAIVEALQTTPKAARAEFDDFFKKRYPEFAGIKGATTAKGRGILSQQLDDRPAIRTALANELDKARWRDMGLPNIGNLRQAVNDPNLARAPTESFGYSLGRIDPETGLVLEGPLQHQTYRAQLPGEYLGGLESQVPANIMFPSFFDDAMSAPTARREDIGYRLKRGVKTQKMDQEWLDTIMTYLEWARSEGDLNW